MNNKDINTKNTDIKDTSIKKDSDTKNTDVKDSNTRNTNIKDTAAKSTERLNHETPSASKKSFKTELNKLKQMNASDRVWYIWEYYKIPIFAIILCIFLLYEVGACIYRNMQDTMLYCVTVNETSLLSSDFKTVQKEFEARNDIDKTWRKDTVFDCSLSVDESNEEVYDQYYNTASNIKLTSLLATDTVDVLITVPQMFSYYTSQNAYLELSDFLSDDLYKRLEQEDRLLTAADGDGNQICAGISLDNSYLSEKLSLEEGSVLSVCTDKNYPDIVRDFIEYAIWGN